VCHHRVPLSSITGHVEGHEEHLAGVLGVLDPEELVAPIQPWQRIIHTIIGGEQQLMGMAGRGCDQVVTALDLLAVASQELVVLEVVDGDGQLALIALNCCERCCELVHDGAQLCNLYLRRERFWRN
jgi:hypothetical protein